MPATTSDDVNIRKPRDYVAPSIGTANVLGTLPVLAGVFLLSINLWVVVRLGHFVTQNPVSLLLITSSCLVGLFMLIYAFAVLQHEKSRSYADFRKYHLQLEEYLEAVDRYKEHVATIRELAIKRPQT